MVISLVASFKTLFGFWAEKSTIMTVHWEWAVNRLVGWCKGWCEVKVEQLCIIYPASQFSSIHPGLSLYKKNLLVHLLTNGVNWAESENDLLTLFQFDDLDGISGKSWWGWRKFIRMRGRQRKPRQYTIMLIIRLEGQRWRNPWWDYQKVSDSGTALPLVAPSVAPLQCIGGQIGAFEANGANYVDNENEHDHELFPS